MERRMSISGPASVESVTMVEIAMAKVAAVEVAAIDDRSAVRDIRVVVVDYPSAVPVVSPVMPAPSKSPEEADSKSNPERDCRPSKKDPRYGIPAWICNDRVAVHEPRIVRGDVNHFRIRGFDDDCVPLRCYLFLFIAIQVAGLVSLLPHHLDGIRHILLLIGVRIAKG